MAYPTHLRGASRPSHPLHPTWRSWRAMRSRCREGRPGYEGVTIDPAWDRSFEAFLESVGPRPAGQGWSLDRIDSATGYGPGLCRWQRAAGQAQNRRTTRLYRLDGIGGEAVPLSYLAEVFDRDPAALRARLRLGWSLDRCLDVPTRRSFLAGLTHSRRMGRLSTRTWRRRRKAQGE